MLYKGVAGLGGGRGGLFSEGFEGLFGGGGGGWLSWGC